MNSLLDSGLQFRKLRGKISMAREGALQIFETVKTMMEDKAQGNLFRSIDNWSGAALKATTTSFIEKIFISTFTNNAGVPFFGRKLTIDTIGIQVTQKLQKLPLQFDILGSWQAYGELKKAILNHFVSF